MSDSMVIGLVLSGIDLFVTGRDDFEFDLTVGWRMRRRPMSLVAMLMFRRNACSCVGVPTSVYSNPRLR